MKEPFSPEVRILDHGSLQLLDVMGSDESIEAAARVSYGKGTRTKTETRGLIRYLMKHRHTSPFEMAEMQFKVKCPIFVARQWVRHRTANMNEMSGRYSEMPNEFWLPDEWRGQGTVNKQGSEGTVALGGSVGTGDLEREAFQEYRHRLNSGVSREMARSCLPLSTYTEFVWKIDLHNLLHFLSLRLDSHAQAEIREYAQRIAGWVKIYFPLTWEAFVDYRLEAVTFSMQEMQFLKILARAAWHGPHTKWLDYLKNTDLAKKEKIEFLKKLYPAWAEADLERIV